MKILLVLITVIILSALARLGYLGFQSQSGSAAGLVAGRLSPCPDTPNCLCSEFEADSSHYVEALPLGEADAGKTMAKIKQLLEQMGGSIQAQTPEYIAAIFTSSIFRYIDDFEVRLDRENGLIHLRSASRVGRGDFGANLQRIEAFKQGFGS